MAQSCSLVTDFFLLPLPLSTRRSLDSKSDRGNPEDMQGGDTNVLRINWK